MRSYLVFIAAMAAMIMTPTAQAGGPWHREFQDLKLPSQMMQEHQLWTTPAAASSTLLKSGQAVSSVAATTISTFLAQPDFARNIVLTPGGTTTSFAAGTAVVSGKNIFGASISENFTIASAQSSAVTGSKAFASVSSVVIPVASNTGATMSVGSGVKLGLLRCVKNAGDYDFSEYGGVYETTRGTMAVHATAVESNTFTANGTLDAAHDVDVIYMQNYRCYGGQ